MVIASSLDPRTLIAGIVDELRLDPRVDAGRIGIGASDGGTVVLSGVVRTFAEKCWAEELVNCVPGVTSVRNEIEVRLTIGDYRTDDCLRRVANDVVEALAGLPPQRPRVNVRDGWLTLAGTVTWPYQKQIVEDTLRQIAGIRGIVNDISVESPPPPRAFAVS